MISPKKCAKTPQTPLTVFIGAYPQIKEKPPSWPRRPMPTTSISDVHHAAGFGFWDMSMWQMPWALDVTKPLHCHLWKKLGMWASLGLRLKFQKFSQTKCLRQPPKKLCNHVPRRNFACVIFGLPWLQKRSSINGYKTQKHSAKCSTSFPWDMSNEICHGKTLSIRQRR